MRRSISLLLLLPLAGLASCKAANDKAELEKLRGKWVVHKFYDNGDWLAPDDVNLKSFSFDGEQVTITKSDGTSSGTVYVQGSKSPAQMDITSLNAQGKNETQECIYKLEGDELTICFSCAETNRTRPAAFTGAYLNMWVCKRSK